MHQHLHSTICRCVELNWSNFLGDWSSRRVTSSSTMVVFRWVSLFCTCPLTIWHAQTHVESSTTQQTWEDPTFIHPNAEGMLRRQWWFWRMWDWSKDHQSGCEYWFVAYLHHDSIIETYYFLPIQEIHPGKVLGIRCMIDVGKADWKVGTIDVEDEWVPHFRNKYGTVIRRGGADHSMSCEKRSMDSSAVMCLCPQMYYSYQEQSIYDLGA